MLQNGMVEIPGKGMHAPRYVLSSMTRIAPLAEIPFAVRALARPEWATGDYVVGEVVRGSGALARVEVGTGRMAEVANGDLVVGVLGHREATLEVVGSWRAIGDNLEMQAMTSAGLFGRATSVSELLPRLLTLRYRGHVLVDGRKQTMSGFVTEAPDAELEAPMFLLIGTSMNAGKTVAAKTLIRLLKQEGHRVVGAKLTGAGRYRDILSMADAGADAIFDFVDVGLPSTVCAEATFRARLKLLLRKIASAEPEVVVAEAGASPLEPYNGAIAVEELRGMVCFTVLCASDPYAAHGVIEAFGTRPSLITGIATSTSAGIRLAERLTQVPAINLLATDARPALRLMIRERLGKLTAA